MNFLSMLLNHCTQIRDSHCLEKHHIVHQLCFHTVLLHQAPGVEVITAIHYIVSSYNSTCQHFNAEQDKMHIAIQAKVSPAQKAIVSL